MDVKPKTAGQFYTDEAAYLVSAAARARQVAATPRPAPAPRQPAYAEPILDEPDRPPLAPEPAINQNRAAALRPQQEFVGRPRQSLGRVLARIVLAPWYVAVALATLGIIALIVKAFFGL